MMVGSFSDCKNTAVSLVPSAEVMGLDAADLAAEFFLNMLVSCCFSEKEFWVLLLKGRRNNDPRIVRIELIDKTETLAHHAPSDRYYPFFSV